MVKGRLDWLDYLRALTIISMFFYHWMWDVVYIYGENYPWYEGTIGHIWQQSVCWSFIIISGFSLRLGRRYLVRGLWTFGCGLAISFITCLFMQEMRIIFGVLTFLGVAALLVGTIKEPLAKVPPMLGLFVFGVLFFITKNINMGYLGFEGLNFYKLHSFLYRNIVTTFFGFPHGQFFSTDYFSLFPWIFLYLVGFYLYGLWERFDIKDQRGFYLPILGFIGKHSLAIYVIHQPLIYVVLILIYKMIGR